MCRQLLKTIFIYFAAVIMEQALNRRFVSISLKIKDVDHLIECLERQKQITNEKLEKAQISK